MGSVTETNYDEYLNNNKDSIKDSIIQSKRIANKFPKIVKIHDEEKPLLSDKQVTLLKSLVQFYQNDVYKKLILSIVKQETSISLRLLDWLATNYSKKNNVRYELGSIEKDGTILSSQNFNLWKEYKNQLKAYSKKLFDPFCRRQRIFFNVITNEIIIVNNENEEELNNNKDGFITTVGQLNFFKWAILNKVIDYAFNHLADIESDMLKSADQRIEKKISSGSTKKTLSKNNHGAKGHELKVVVQFS